MTETATPPVKVAISYSWTTKAHKEWVRSLADRLINDRIDVVIDVYDFNFGDDTIKYMESFVNDPSISKVLLVSDRMYTEKANGRTGGVGIESQIISPEVYRKQVQSRFIPIVTEFDAEQQPYLPTFLTSRYYVDLSSVDSFEENYEALVQSINDKPLYKKPALGKRPSYLDDETESRTTTFFKARTLINAVRNERRTTSGFLDDYLSVLSGVLHGDQFKPLEPGVSPHKVADVVREKAAFFLPYKTEFVEVMTNLNRYGAVESQSSLDALHDFFNSLLILIRPDKYDTLAFDPSRFVVYELFITCIATLLKSVKFTEAAYLLEQEYLDPELTRLYQSESLGLTNFNIFDAYMRSFELASGLGVSTFYKPAAALLLDRGQANAKMLSAEDLLNADATLYCRGFSTSTTPLRWSGKTIDAR